MSRNKGFGSKKEEPVVKDPLLRQEEGRIYSMPALYDLAFGYRNFEHEVDFLLYAHEQFAGSTAASVLELAAGPARHSLEALLLDDGSIRRATALDSSSEMVKYGKDLATQELGEAITSFQYLEGDMRNFHVPQTHDTAWILLGSLQHMTTNDDVQACFRNVHKALNPGGTLILELPHPRETFSMVECTRNGWEVPLEDDAGDAYGELQIVWGDENDTFDPITQVRQFSVSMEIKSDLPVSGLKSVKEIVPIRLFTSQEICALATSCHFKIVAMFGALDEEVSVNDDEAFRLVCVLQKTMDEH